MKRLLTVTIIVIGIFLVTAVTVYILDMISETSDRSTLIFALISGAIVAGGSLPVLIWLSLRPANLENYSAYALEEMELSEDELNEAVGNWIYMKHKRRMENEARFLEDEDGNVTCRVGVRKD